MNRAVDYTGQCSFCTENILILPVKFKGRLTVSFIFPPQLHPMSFGCQGREVLLFEYSHVHSLHAMPHYQPKTVTYPKWTATVQEEVAQHFLSHSKIVIWAAGPTPRWLALSPTTLRRSGRISVLDILSRSQCFPSLK